MNKQMYWGIAALIIVLIAAGGFMYWQWSSVQQLKEQLAEERKMLEENEKPVAEDKPPRPAREGYKWEWHGDHWHEMPMAQAVVDKIPPNEGSDLAARTYETSDFLKSDLPDELPAEPPTDAEIQQMSYADLNHLTELYRREGIALAKTDVEAGARLYNQSSRLVKRMREIHEKESAEVMAREREHRKKLPISFPQTEESPAVIIDVTPSSNGVNEGGKQ